MHCGYGINSLMMSWCCSACPFSLCSVTVLINVICFVQVTSHRRAMRKKDPNFCKLTYLTHQVVNAHILVTRIDAPLYTIGTQCVWYVTWFLFVLGAERRVPVTPSSSSSSSSRYQRRRSTGSRDERYRSGKIETLVTIDWIIVFSFISHNLGLCYFIRIRCALGSRSGRTWETQWEKDGCAVAVQAAIAHRSNLNGHLHSSRCVHAPFFCKRTVCACASLLLFPVFVQTHPLALMPRGLWGGRGVSTWTPGSAELCTAHLQRHHRLRLTATALPTQLDWQRPACTPMAVSLCANIQTSFLLNYRLNMTCYMCNSCAFSLLFCSRSDVSFVSEKAGLKRNGCVYWQWFRHQALVWLPVRSALVVSGFWGSVSHNSSKTSKRKEFVFWSSCVPACALSSACFSST